MESVEFLHNQLNNLNELRNIVKTMKALSAASIRQYEQAVIAVTSYYQTVERGLHIVLKDMESPSAAALDTRAPKRHAAIVFGSDHGLCGKFNEEISQHALNYEALTKVQPENRFVLAIGARVAASLENEGQVIKENFMVPNSAAQITATVEKILVKIDEWDQQSGVHYVYLFYNRHSGKRYHPTGVELLPIDLKRFLSLQEERWPSRSLPTFTMNRDALFSRLLHQYLFVSIFRACAESQASEHASRLAAMQSAQRNLDDRVEEVTMSFHRARQNVITSELLDLASGFEAITNPKT